MKQITAILFLTFICHFNPLFSQSKTPYEKKKEELSIKYLKKMGVSINEINRAKNADESGMLLFLLIGDKVQQYQYSNPMESLVLMAEWEKEMKNAEKLKNSADFEKEKKASDAIKAKEVEQQKKYEERQRLEAEEELKKKAKEEHEMAEQRKSALWKQSDLLGIFLSIKKDFESWAKKGEFETSSEHEARMQKKIFVFDSISIRYINFGIQNYYKQYSNNDGEFVLELLKYNPDKNEYPFVLRKEFYLDGFGNEEISIIDTLHIGIEEAKKIKEQGKNYDSNKGTLFTNLAERPTLQFFQNIDDWILVDDFLFPKVFIVAGHKHILNQKHISLEELKIETTRLKLTEYFTENYSFNVKDYNSKLKEIKRDKLILDANLSNSKGDLNEALRLFISANEIRFSDDIKNKINELDFRLLEIKRNKLIAQGKQFISEGKLSKSIEIYEEANSLKKSDSLQKQIQILKEEINVSFKKHTNIDSNFTKIRLNNFYFNKHKVSDDKLENVKKGYSETYNKCLMYLTDTLNFEFNIISKEYDKYIKNRNIEVWHEKYKSYEDLILKFEEKLIKYSTFEERIFQAIQNEDKKFLKILKEENINLIIEKVIKPN